MNCKEINACIDALDERDSIIVRIPVKWGTDSGDVGQCRSEATLGISMIGEVPHMSQESSGTVVQSASFRFFFRGDRKVAFR